MLIIVFAALAGASNTVSAIVGFRAGWGLGNALFVATALSTIVMSASGLHRAGDHPVRGRPRASASRPGPLIGGLLGEQSWRARSSASPC